MAYGRGVGLQHQRNRVQLRGPSRMGPARANKGKQLVAEMGASWRQHRPARRAGRGQGQGGAGGGRSAGGTQTPRPMEPAAAEVVVSWGRVTSSTDATTCSSRECHQRRCDEWGQPRLVPGELVTGRHWHIQLRLPRSAVEPQGPHTKGHRDPACSSPGLPAEVR
jgi:hypothetical protein